MTKLTQREFGRIVGIGSLGLMVGCTTEAVPGKSTRKVAVVGGGFGGATLDILVIVGSLSLL